MRVVKTQTIVATGVLLVSVSAPANGYVGVPITISASWDGVGVGPFRGNILWGDGYTESWGPQDTKSLSKSHTYSTSGTYTIQVNVNDDYTGSTGSGSASTTIRVALSVLLLASPTGGNIPLTVMFTCSAAGGYLNYSWTLNPGDGSSPYSGTRAVEGPWTQSHTYNNAGSFTATLTVTDALGASVVSRSPIRAGVLAIPLKQIVAIIAPLASGLIILKMVR